MTFYWKQCRCNSWWPLPFARRTLPGCSQAKPSRRNLQGWPQHWSGRLSSRWRMLQIWIGNCLVFFLSLCFLNFWLRPFSMLFAAFGSWNLRVCKPFAAFWSWNLSLWMLFATLYIWNFPFRMLFAAFGGWNQRYLQHFWTSTFHFAWQLSFWLIIEALWNLNLLTS